MCEAIEGIIYDAREEGLKEGFFEALVGLVKDEILTIADAAKRANVTVPEFEQKMSIQTDSKEKTLFFKMCYNEIRRNPTA